jgi:hypothetical protein
MISQQFKPKAAAKFDGADIADMMHTFVKMVSDLKEQLEDSKIRDVHKYTIKVTLEDELTPASVKCAASDFTFSPPITSTVSLARVFAEVIKLCEVDGVKFFDECKKQLVDNVMTE